MKKQTIEKLSKALQALADGLGEIREMGLLELRLKFKGVLAKVEHAVREAAEAISKEDA